jgi:hypothetical protein
VTSTTDPGPIVWEPSETEDGAKGEEFVARWRGLTARILLIMDDYWGGGVVRDDGDLTLFDLGEERLQVCTEYLTLSHLGARTLCEMALWAASSGWRPRAPGSGATADAATSPAALARQVDGIARATTEALLSHAKRLARLEAAAFGEECGP